MAARGNEMAVPPVVTVIVPARNEEAAIARCLASLVEQQDIAREIIVVDDASSDSTRQIASSFPNVTVVVAPPLPDGWCGKNHALDVGVKIARGKWLLFTDADTAHRPGSLSRAVAEAEEHGADLLSYSPHQEVIGFWQRAVMPNIFAELTRVYRTSDVNDPASKVAAANGQFLLMTREAYDAVGGHAAVASEILEDVALARNVKQSGRKLRFRYGGDQVSARMYRSFGQLREGWTKNLALLFRDPEQLALKRATEFTAGALAIGMTLAGLLRRNAPLALVGATVAVPVYTNYFRRILRAHFGTVNTLLAPLGVPLFVYLLLRSQYQHTVADQVRWKGRTYRPGANMQQARQQVASD